VGAGTGATFFGGGARFFRGGMGGFYPAMTS